MPRFQFDYRRLVICALANVGYVPHKSVTSALSHCSVSPSCCNSLLPVFDHHCLWTVYTRVCKQCDTMSCTVQYIIISCNLPLLLMFFSQCMLNALLLFYINRKLHKKTLDSNDNFQIWKTINEPKPKSFSTDALPYFLFSKILPEQLWALLPFLLCIAFWNNSVHQQHIQKSNQLTLQTNV